ncbi:MAG: hypothetical protein ACFFES_18085 [Candidatus Thorarchaeota archaeon]
MKMRDSGPILPSMTADQCGAQNSPESSLPWWFPYAVFAGITLILAIPIISNIDNWGVRDWDLFTTLHAATVRSVVEYGQFPFWNPYIGGGNILFAHPEAAVLHPFFVILLLFGALIGLKLQLIIVYFIGMSGMYKLARQFSIGRFGSMTASVAFMLSSFLTLHFAAGHIPFHYFALFPWLVFFYRKSLDRQLHILSAGAVTAFMILGSGAAVPMLFSLFFLLLISLLDSAVRKDWRPPLFAIAAGACGMLFGAIKFFPMVDYFLRHPWIPEQFHDTTPLSLLPTMLFSFDQSLFAEYSRGYIWGWHEYGAFVGPVAMLLTVIGIVKGIKKGWPYVVLAGVSFLLVLGSFIPGWSPWDMLHRLPGFESIRVPSRFAILGLFGIAFLAGIGVDIVLSWLREQSRWVGPGIVIVVLGTHLAVCLPILTEIFTRPPEEPIPHEDFQQTVGDPNRMYWALLSNRGTIRSAWISGYHRLGRGILDQNNQPSEWNSTNGLVRVLGREFTPNRIVYLLDTDVGGMLVVSQGYEAGWRRADGGEIRPFQDLVAFYVSPQDSEVEIYYFPDYFIAGMITTLVSIGAAIFLALRFRLR